MKVSGEIKKWIENYIRENRKSGCISLHVVFSDFNKNFKTKFGVDSKQVLGILIDEGFLRGQKAKGGFSIWLPEDEGQGKRKPFSSHKRRKSDESARKLEDLTTEEGEEEMDANMGKKIRYNINTIGTVNPETGKKDDLVATAKSAVTHLATLCKQDDEGRYIGNFPITSELEKVGFIGSMPHFVMFLSYMGLARRYTVSGGKKGESPHRYLVLDPTFFDLLVTEETVQSVLKMMAERYSKQREVADLKKQLEKTSVSNQENDAEVPSSSESEEILAQMAEMVVLVERLREEKGAVIAELEQAKKQLNDRPTLDAKAVAASLLAQARGEVK